MVGVSVGAGVEVAAYWVTVGVAVGADVGGMAVRVRVRVSVAGGGGVGDGVEIEVQLLVAHPPAAIQAASVAPANVRRTATP